MSFARAAVLHTGAPTFQIEAVELAELRPDEVLVEIQASGICHTDLMARDLVKRPVVLGHEGAGIVAALGADVRGIQVGDAATISYPFCGACRGCLQGEPYHCDQHMPLAFSGARLDGSQPIRRKGEPISSAFFQQSSFATHAITPAASVVVGHADIAPVLRAAAACGVQTGAGAVLESFALRPGQGIAVFGAGTVGLSAVLAARTCGADPIVAIDREPRRLALARRLGATRTLCVSDLDSLESDVRDSAPGGLDFTLETSGHPRLLEAAIASLRTGGECGMVIAPHFGQKYPFSPSEVFKRAARLRGIIQGSAVPRVFLPKLFALYRRGAFDFSDMIATYPLERVNDAVADLEGGRVVKAVLRMEPR